VLLTPQALPTLAEHASRALLTPTATVVMTVTDCHLQMLHALIALQAAPALLVVLTPEHPVVSSARRWVQSPHVLSQKQQKLLSAVSQLSQRH
jgi:hypothetical protein